MWHRIYHGIVDLIENNRAKVPVAKTTGFAIEDGEKYPFLLFDDDTFQVAS